MHGRVEERSQKVQRDVPHGLQESSDPESEFHHRNLVDKMLSLFFAGTESTSTTLCYALLLFLKHPDVLGEYGEQHWETGTVMGLVHNGSVGGWVGDV